MTDTVRRRVTALENGQSATQVLNNLTVNGTLSGGDSAVGLTKYVRQSADVTKTESATLSNLTGLVHTVVPGTYRYRVVLQTTSTANGGTKVAFKYTTAALTSLQNQSLTATASANASTRVTTATDQASLVAATAANLLVILEGTMVVSTGGTVQVQGAQNASHADTTTYLTGSTFEITRIA
jgi:hypothetical protein